MSSDLVLRTRLDALQASLEEVVQVVASLEQRQGEVALLLEASPVDLLQRVTVHIKMALLHLQLKDPDQAARVLTSLSKEAEEALEKLQAIDFASISSRISPVVTSGALGSTLKELLVNVAEKEIRGIEDIRRALDDSSALAASGDDEQADQRRAEAWRLYYDSDFSSRCQRAFGEYFDLLGGMALRDSGFDGDICRLADQLISDFGDFRERRWASLTVPARHQALDATLSRIVRLGYPEWSIWALPLTAHEFGHIVVGWHEEISAFVAETAVDDQAGHQLRVRLADAFATFWMGPAYACAAILLRFEPPFDETDDLVFRRAEVVLGMLRHMDQRNAEMDLFREVIDQLTAAWNEAVRRSGVTREPLGDEVSDDAADLCRRMAGWLAWGRAMQAERWVKVRDELAPLLSRAGVEALEPGAERAYELRDVLNAAWDRRLSATGMAEIREIDDAAESLCRRIVNGLKASTGQGGPLARGRSALSGASPPKPSGTGVPQDAPWK